MTDYIYEPKDLLAKARERIADPEDWCEGALAIDAVQGVVEPSDPAADRWCAVGAVDWAAERLCEHGITDCTRDDATDLLDEAARAVFKVDGATTVNDELGHESVLALFDEVVR